MRAAERTLAADTARIGVAVADLYPTITLAGSIGLNATRGSQLFKATSVNYSIGPLISWSIPNQTIARARIRQAEAGADASLARFDAAVLTALRETEQALARYAAALDRDRVLQRAEQSSTEAARLSRLRFVNGADSFLLLIDAERDRATARAARAQADAAVADAQISLFKALGRLAGGARPDPARRRRGGADREIDVRTRQSVCTRKRRFATVQEAITVARAATIVLLPYRCDRCRRFHLTSRTKGKRAVRQVV